jgi:hypothetical protein
LLANARKKIRLEEKAISEILFADTDLKSGAEASNVKDCFEKEEKEERQQPQIRPLQQQASTKVKPQAATIGRLPTWRPPQGRKTNIHPFVSPPKGVKKVRLHTSTKTAHQCLC